MRITAPSVRPRDQVRTQLKTGRSGSCARVRAPRTTDVELGKPLFVRAPNQHGLRSQRMREADAAIARTHGMECRWMLSSG